MTTSAQFERSADFRGSYPQEVNEELAFLTGQLFVLFLHASDCPAKILVGRDGRLHSLSLYQAITQGIKSVGGLPIPVGLATTDALTWGIATGWRGASAGVMLTASHNRDPRDHGIKMLRRRVEGIEPVQPKRDLKPLLNPGLLAAFRAASPICSQQNFEPRRTTDLCGEFVQHACSFAPDRKQFRERVILDAGNGVACLLADLLESEIPSADIECIGAPIDGLFPDRGPDPTASNALAALQQRVVKAGAAFGVAFDGDADRVVFVMEDGRIVSPQTAMSMMAEVILTAGNTHHRDPRIVFASPSTWQIIDVARKHVAVPVVTKVGQDSIKHAMRAVAAVAGFEHSGHFNFGCSFGQDSGLIAMMHLWQSLHASETHLSAVVDGLPPWAQSGDINIRVVHMDVSANFERLLDAMVEHYCPTRNSGYASRLDGLSLYFPFTPDIPTENELFPRLYDEPSMLSVRGVHATYRPEWWFNVRCSKTESLIRLNVESRDPDALSELALGIVDRIRTICEELGTRCTTQVVDWGSLTNSLMRNDKQV